ncbi:cilia- and flagella-associated protein 221-like isoform X2 [Haliotis rufescens]|uniref:cilia- and flagella-associated protein 221-like isoform X2 n=1 Tax=Haliotis rufescens TaxID=6454 RepID=UPI001EB06839|nr:cilia- and flagella-associated protein 221-like isoform X2 [Haliotis rufescens]
MPTLGAVVRAGSRPVSVQMSPRDESGMSPDLLLNTVRLVEPRKKMDIPNHLLETKIYSKVGKNAAIHTRPSNIHFDGFELQKKQTRSFKIVNASSDVLRMHIIPPQSKYFYIKYKKLERMVPGLTLDCTVEFTPDEWRYYYDCIRINCPGEENLVVPIHAYPVMSTKDFPHHFSFSPVPVGHKMSEVFPLYCGAPVDFEFQITYIQPSVAFQISPMSGVVPANSKAEVTVTFMPREFQTVQAKIQLTISQFNSKPILCTFSGHSSPGLLKEISESTYANSEVLDPRCLSPLDRARSKRKPSGNKRPLVTQKKEIEYQGIKFPSVIESPYAVAQVLIQEPGKLRAKDLRESILTKKDTNKPSNRQMKEAEFAHDVRQDVYEERQNQLRWQIRLGEVQISNKKRTYVLEDRMHAWEDYRYNKRGDCVPESEYKRTSTKCTFKRTLRDAAELASAETKFDPYTNDMWAIRHASLSVFRQAGRKVIIRARASHKLASLRKAMIDWSKKKFAIKGLVGEQQEKLDEEEDREDVAQHYDFSSQDVKKYSFPTYIPPNIKDDMAPDALGVVPFKPTEVFVKRKVPYFNLKVPQQYSLLSYKKHDSQNASSGYISPTLTQPLRTGAQDEVIKLAASVDLECSYLEEIPEDDMAPVDVADSSNEVMERTTKQTLSPPEALFKPIEYPPLHIFNPAPGLQVFQAPIPYAEVDPDFHLCPLPRYVRNDHATNPHASTQRRYLNREDIVRGVMGWKKFPSQGLTSLSNTPTLSAVWVARWDDQFGDEMLSKDVPALFDGLPKDDMENIEDEETAESKSRLNGIYLTPEMVNAQFTLIDGSQSSSSDDKLSNDLFPYGNKMPAANIPVGPAGPVPRYKREEELEYFMTKKYNSLGAKITAKTATLNNLVTNQDLRLI